MELDFLNPLYAHAGPFASVYLDTTRATEDAQDEIDLRWRGLRGELERAGADEATLAAIGAAVGEDRGVPGPHGQALVAAGGQVLYSGVLPERPSRDEARLVPLPHVLPLLKARGERIPHVVAVLNRLGADLIAVGYDDVVRAKQVEGEETYPIRKVHAGGWRESHWQRAVENNWEENAEQVAAEIARAADEVAGELIVLSGDVRAKALVRDNLREDLQDRTVEIEAGSRAPGAAGEPLRAEVLRAVREKAAQRVADAVDDFRREWSQGDRAVQGIAPVTAALRRGQVATLLIRADADLGTPMAIGPDPLQLAVDAGELDALGVDEPQQDRADAAMIRALARAEGDLVIVPGNEELRDGVGAVLRFVDASTQR
jgi:Bacterial archaeo-eukaryotic release factor family 2